jgi:subtilisin-like proprotein convertase family protein
LSAFTAANANTTWTLLIADMSGGGQATLVSWGLTVVTVPEPQAWTLLAGGVGMLLAVNRRRKR